MRNEESDMSIIQHLTERGLNLSSDELDTSLDLKDSPIKIDSDVVVDDKKVDKSDLGEYVDFDELELDYFKTKALIPADKVDKDSVQWNWDDENLEDYIVMIKKREWLGDDGDYVYEIIQVGDAEITNKNNPYLGTDRDAYSIPFIDSSFDFIQEVMKSVGVFE